MRRRCVPRRQPRPPALTAVSLCLPCQRVVAYMGQKAANIMGFFLTGVGLLGLPLTAVVTDPNTPAMWVGVVLSILIYGSGTAPRPLTRCTCSE